MSRNASASTGGLVQDIGFWLRGWVQGIRGLSKEGWHGGSG